MPKNSRWLSKIGSQSHRRRLVSSAEKAASNSWPARVVEPGIKEQTRGTSQTHRYVFQHEVYKCRGSETLWAVAPLRGWSHALTREDFLFKRRVLARRTLIPVQYTKECKIRLQLWVCSKRKRLRRCGRLALVGDSESNEANAAR